MEPQGCFLHHITSVVSPLGTDQRSASRTLRFGGLFTTPAEACFNTSMNLAPNSRKHPVCAQVKMSLTTWPTPQSSGRDQRGLFRRWTSNSVRDLELSVELALQLWFAHDTPRQINRLFPFKVKVPLIGDTKPAVPVVIYS
eukprot:248964-Amphidinium_carterae.1